MDALDMDAAATGGERCHDWRETAEKLAARNLELTEQLRAANDSNAFQPNPEIARAFSRWLDVRQAVSAPGLSDDAADVLVNEEFAAMEAMIGIPSRSPADALLKIYPYAIATQSGDTVFQIKPRDDDQYDGAIWRALAIDLPALSPPIAAAMASQTAGPGSATLVALPVFDDHQEPHIGWYAERRATFARANAPACTEQESDAAGEELNRLEGLILGTPAVTPSGVTAKLLVIAGIEAEGGDGSASRAMIEAEAVGLMGSVHALSDNAAGLIAALGAAEKRIRLPYPDEGSDEEADTRCEEHYAILKRVQALPNTPDNLSVRARAVCSAIDYTGVAAEISLDEMAAHAEGYAGELIRDILACLLGQRERDFAEESPVR